MLCYLSAGDNVVCDRKKSHTSDGLHFFDSMEKHIEVVWGICAPSNKNSYVVKITTK